MGGKRRKICGVIGYPSLGEGGEKTFDPHGDHGFASSIKKP